MNRIGIVATHHKTGTVWMAKTFRTIGNRLNIPVTRVSGSETLQRDSLSPPHIVHLPHGFFKHCDWMLEPGEHRIVHLIRDPRDVIISGMHYHLRSKEAWLDVSREQFGGKTYRAQLQEAPDNDARYRLEMGMPTIPDMTRWNYTMPHAMEVKYEDLIADADARLFAGIATHLGFADDELRLCQKVFRKRSLSGGAETKPGHVRSGKARQWENVFDRPLARKFIECFGDVLIRLGYEPDNSWAERLPEKAASA